MLFSYIHLIENNQWDLFNMFSKVDVFGLTTYPWKHFNSPKEIDSDYYSKLKKYVTKPIAFTEIGWAGDETEQAEFLVKFLELIKGNNVEMVNWLCLHELGFTGIGKSVFDPETKTIALKKAEGTRKEIYDVWLDLKEMKVK